MEEITGWEANKRLRHERIRFMFQELKSYHLDQRYIIDALSQFFAMHERSITNRLNEPNYEVEYDHWDLDIKWCEGLAKKAIKKSKRKQEQNKNRKQIKLNI